MTAGAAGGTLGDASQGVRPIALGRKNALFAGSDAAATHWAIALTLIQSAKLNDTDPPAYLTDVLSRIVSGKTRTHQLDPLLPWEWQPERGALISAAA